MTWHFSPRLLKKNKEGFFLICTVSFSPLSVCSSSLIPYRMSNCGDTCVHRRPVVGSISVSLLYSGGESWGQKLTWKLMSIWYDPWRQDMSSLEYKYTDAPLGKINSLYAEPVNVVTRKPGYEFEEAGESWVGLGPWRDWYQWGKIRCTWGFNDRIGLEAHCGTSCVISGKWFNLSGVVFLYEKIQESFEAQRNYQV